MCGIYGVVGLEEAVETDPQVLAQMASTLVHRGPDGRGEFIDDRAALGVQRLRIIDRENPNTQPFRDLRSGVVVVCNGEIYNADVIRHCHSDYPFCSDSDIEPILPLYLKYGPAALSRLEGMYALALWDPRNHKLLLARDPSGEKPLFAAVKDGVCVFGSEIQTVLVHPEIDPTLNRDAVADIITMGYTVGPKTMFSGIWSVQPGKHGNIDSPWDCAPPSGIRTSRPHQPIHQLEALLTHSVRAHLRADVPVGIFSSGGVDSALIAALAVREVGPNALHTFAVGFEEQSYDERGPARTVAEFLGVKHTDVIATHEDLATELRHVIERVAEPIGDPAVLPTAILARTAKRDVGVVLSGEGADELFGGYPTYVGHALSPAFRALPEPARRLMAGLVYRIPPSDRKVPLRWLIRRFVDYASLDTPVRHVAWFGGQIIEPALNTELGDVWASTADRFEPLGRIMYFDFCTYLRALLVKIDRATMLASLESRAPYLHQPLSQFAFTLPDDLRTKGIRTKPLLKAVARRHLPRNIVGRRKRGLSVPISRLMRRELRAEFDRHVRDERFEHIGLLRPGRVSELVTEHTSGRAHHARALWTLLVLGLWTEQWTGA